MYEIMALSQLMRGGQGVKSHMELLRELREDRDLTQAQVAQVLGTTQQVYSRYEQGINELPVRHLRTLCLFYRVSADYLLGLPPWDRGRGTRKRDASS